MPDAQDVTGLGKTDTGVLQPLVIWSAVVPLFGQSIEPFSV